MTVSTSEDESRRGPPNVRSTSKIAKPASRGWKITPFYTSPVALTSTPSDKGGWQDISTAPKDGSAVLLYDRSFRSTSKAIVGWWKDDSNGERWIIGAGSRVFPTHWMLLPSPPSALSSTGGSDG